MLGGNNSYKTNHFPSKFAELRHCYRSGESLMIYSFPLQTVLLTLFFISIHSINGNFLFSFSFPRALGNLDICIHMNPICDYQSNHTMITTKQQQNTHKQFNLCVWLLSWSSPDCGRLHPSPSLPNCTSNAHDFYMSPGTIDVEMRLACKHTESHTSTNVSTIAFSLWRNTLFPSFSL